VKKITLKANMNIHKAIKDILSFKTRQRSKEYIYVILDLALK
jgi:tRNA A37 threonylcarbamoyladenosine synthetase subunit TsaC/SUA5/YrdC